MKKIVSGLILLIFWISPTLAADMSAVAGVYLNQRDDTQFLTLRPDASFVLRQRKKPPDKDNPFVEFNGNYEINGETISLKLADGGQALGQLKGNVFTDGQGEIWVKRGTEQHNVTRPKSKPWYR